MNNKAPTLSRGFIILVKGAIYAIRKSLHAALLFKFLVLAYKFPFRAHQQPSVTRSRAVRLLQFRAGI